MKIAINGLGRIGRHVLRIALENNINIVAINDLVNPEDLAYLIKYDSVYGRFDKKIQSGKDFLKIGNKKIEVFGEKEPSQLPWKKLGIDIVVECTGLFTDRENASKHLKAGAKKVLISAPAKNPDITIVPGVNHKKLKKQHKIISMASCTTNCLAPIAKVLNDKFKIKKGFMTTIHAYTSSQNILDAPHKKLRRGRAGALNLVPTTTGATKAVIEVLPECRNKLNGLAIRAPVPTGSIVDFVVELQRKTSIKEINKEFEKQANGKLKGILQYTEDEIVSSDIIKNTHSSIFDAKSTQIIGQGNKGNFVKVLSWYDNEYGYSCRLIDVIKMLK